jgi:deoxyuridine 5'-triphosphate nucleotidohydrolase
MKVARLNSASRVPVKSSAGSAGFDLFASEDSVVPATSVTGRRVAIGRALVSTGIAIAIPKGYVGKIGSRSGLSVDRNIEVGAGWIDPDYRGEIKIELKNFGPMEFVIEAGMRIAQLFVLRLGDVRLESVRQLPASRRGARGFGSTGLR